MAVKTRWIGFDMDECIGSVMPLHTFATEIPQIGGLRAVTAMQRSLIDSELAGLTWILRPVMIPVLRRVYAAYRRGDIAGAFLYSNNSSPELIEFVMYLCDGIMWRLAGDRRRPRIFKMGVYYGAACRPKDSLVKDYGGIQACLAAHGLPQCSTTADLLFFDDLVHVLKGEIANYVQVPPYFNHTSVHTLIQVFRNIEQIVGNTEWARITETALQMQARDLSEKENHYVIEAQGDSDRNADIEIFMGGLQRFLGARGGKSRRFLRRRRRATRRKNRAFN